MKVLSKLTLVILLAATTAASAQQLLAGAAQVNITPPKGAPMAGYYTNRAATGTHDDLFAKTILLEVNGVKVALVACDVVGLPKEITDEARRIVQQKTGIAPEHVMISATHTHTGPVILTMPSRYNLEGEMKSIAVAYTATLPAKIADSVVRANAALQPAQIRSAIGKEDSLGFNRRYFMSDGTIGWNPGKLNPKIVRPAGPVDTDVEVMSIETLDGKTIAIYTNFAVHQDTTGGLEFSADYAYTLGRVLAMAKGDNIVSLFTIGCAGNVNHFDTSLADKQQGYEEAARIGAVLAGDVLKIIQHAPIIPVSKIKVSSKMLSFPVAPLSKEQLDWAHRTQATFGTANPAPFLDLVRAATYIDMEARHGKPFPAEVQVIALGDKIAIVSFPGEMFAELGMMLKEDSPYPITIPAELANGLLNYIPNRAAFLEGQYEVLNSQIGVGGGEALVESALSQLLTLSKP